MSKTWKDSKKNKELRKEQRFDKPKFQPSKGRKPKGNLKDLVRDGRNLDDFFV